MNVGQRITALRTERGLTVNKLATLSGVSQSYLRDIELGNKQPTVEYLDYICSGLNITLSDFFACDDNSALEKAILRLSPDQRKLLLDFLNAL